MRKIGLAVLVAVLVCTTATAAETKKVDLTTKAAKQGYAIGYQLGSDFKAKSIEVDTQAMAAGVTAAMKATTPEMKPEEIHAVLSDVQKQVDAARREAFMKKAEENKKDGEKFLAENGKKAGVTTLPSGLQYKIIKKGDGPKPTATSKVTVNYRGTLPDGTEFDNSYKRGQPVTFQVDRVVKGWTEALQLMPTGSKWMLYLPASLAYGERGAPPRIGPNQVLVFEVELLKIDNK